MASYRNGIESRELLIAAARRNFAENGYAETSIKNIVTDAHSRLGSFTYYFESKEALALQIFCELQQNVVLRTMEHPTVAALKDDLLLLDMACERVWIRTIARHPHLERFAREISVTNGYLDKSIAERKWLWKQLYPDDPESDEGKIICTLMVGMLVQFAHDLARLRLKGDPEDAIDQVFRAAYALPDLPPERLEAAIRASREAAQPVCIRIDDAFALL